MSYLSYFVSGRWAETSVDWCSLGLKPAFSGVFCAFSVLFGAVLRLEPLTFNPSVLGSNPRGPTTESETKADLHAKLSTLNEKGLHKR